MDACGYRNGKLSFVEPREFQDPGIQDTDVFVNYLSMLV
jgi:hypothetical protein